MEENNNPKVSVIAPVYGVEKFIGRAVESMMNQTLKEVEFIFVDDCTPDCSINIIKEVCNRYPQRAASIRIIHHEVNKGLPAARNTGIEAAQGTYIFHWDSDDYADSTMLETMYQTAINQQSDYVWADWYLTFETNSRIMCQPSASTPRDALTEILAGTMKYNVWNKLVSKELYKSTGIRFPEGKSMGEDMTMIKLLIWAKKVVHINQPFYHYIRNNADAMTQTYSERHLSELTQNTADLCSYLSQHIKDEHITIELHWFKLNVKLPFLFSNRPSDFKLWHSWYSESNRYIMSNYKLSVRTRLLQWTAAHHLTLMNRIYNTLLFNLVYGKIYK